MNPTAGPRRSTGQALSIVLIVLAVGQFVSPVFSALWGGAFTTSGRAGEPLIVPPGWTFSIWFVIEVLSLLYAVWSWWRLRRSGSLTLQRLQIPLIVVFAGFSVWIGVTEIEPTWSNLAVLIIMVVALVRALWVAVAGRDEIAMFSRVERLGLWALLGLYLGWTSMAMWLNLTTAVVATGGPIDGTAGFVGQAAILAGATGTAILLVRIGEALWSYLVAVAWAFVGIVIGAADADATTLSIIAAVGLLVIIATAVVTGLMLRRRGRRPAWG